MVCQYNWAKVNFQGIINFITSSKSTFTHFQMLLEFDNAFVLVFRHALSDRQKKFPLSTNILEITNSLSENTSMTLLACATKRCENVPLNFIATEIKGHDQTLLRFLWSPNLYRDLYELWRYFVWFSKELIWWKIWRRICHSFVL